MEAQSSELVRTNIIAVPPASYAGGVLELTVKNDGQTNSADFAQWDVIVQYQNGDFSYLAYSPAGPEDPGQWTVQGIYNAGGSPETFDPGILDPGEQLTVSITLDRSLSSGQSCEITVSTPNGIKSQTQVTAE